MSESLCLFLCKLSHIILLKDISYFSRYFSAGEMGELLCTCRHVENVRFLMYSATTLVAEYICFQDWG